MDTVNSVAPLKEVRIKQRSESWMSSDILDNIRERDSLLAKFNKNNHMTEYYDEYRKMRNKVQREIKHAKQHYLVNKIDDNKHDSKKLWQNLKELGYQNKSKDSYNIVLDIDGKKCFECKEVADQFNKFFTGVAAKLVGELRCLSLVDFMIWTQKGSKATIGISSLGPLCFTKLVKTLFTMS